MYKKCLILSLVVTFSKCYTQDLLSVNWQQVVCTDGYIDHIYSICNDNIGNIYTLGSFENSANCLGENVNESLGHYFLIKQNSIGEKLFVKNFGGSESFTFGDIKICDNGDIILGLNFKENFLLNGDSITSSTNWSNIILKVDQNFNLKWLKTFPSSNSTYINRLILDNNENIYTSILFIDSLSINGNIYSQNSSYAAAIAKLNSVGDILWSHHYYSDYILTNEVLKIKSNCNSCPNTIYISGNVCGDLLFVDGVLKDQQQSKFNSQCFVATLNEFGDVLETKFFDDGIRSITDIDFYQNKVFFAGSFVDTVKLSNNQVSPIGHASIYIGELNEQADIIGFSDMRSSEEFRLSSGLT